jgi:hypothetical protein
VACVGFGAKVAGAQELQEDDAGQPAQPDASEQAQG